LIYNSRPQALHDEKIESIVSLAFRVYKEEGCGSAESYLFKKYSKAGLTMLKQSKLCREFIYTRECKECAKLSDAEFLAKCQLGEY
jgi:NAD/NADP transhydrogenase alpha subunit